MNLAKIAIEKKAVTYFTVFLLLIGGVMSYFQLGQLEDPDFTIKTAVILTPYPGASPKEVELEVTDRIELSLQELKQVDYIESFSRAGYSQIKVEIKSTFGSKDIPQIWDELRRKVNDVAGQLPPGAGPSVVNDDFGDVFGHLLAVTGEGFSYAELEDYVDELKRELSLVEGVARIDLWGNQQKIVYIDVSETQLSQLGLSEESIEQTLRAQNAVVDAGWTDVQNRRMRIAPTGEFASPADIAELPIRPTIFDTLQSGDLSKGFGASSELIRIGDIGNVREGYQDPPSTLMRYNGKPAIVLSIANLPGVNVVDMGRAVSQRLDELIADLPIGIEPHRVHWQSDVIAESINGFFISLLQAIAIVLGVLAIAMGLAHGLDHRHGLDPDHHGDLHHDGPVLDRPAAHVPGRPGDRARHDGRQRDRRGRGRRGACAPRRPRPRRSDHVADVQDIIRRVRRQHDEVRHLTWLDATEALSNPDRFRRCQRSCSDGFERRESAADEQLHLCLDRNGTVEVRPRDESDACIPGRFRRLAFPRLLIRPRRRRPTPLDFRLHPGQPVGDVERRTQVNIPSGHLGKERSQRFG